MRDIEHPDITKVNRTGYANIVAQEDYLIEVLGFEFKTAE